MAKEASVFHTKMGKISGVACGAALTLALMSGCAGANAQAEEAAKEYRNYMSQVNQIMVELDEGLGTFSDAVSRDDLVDMGAQLDQALKSLDKLDSLEAPKALEDVQKGYVDASDKLEKALTDYVALYSDMSGVSDEDWSDFDKRLSSIQEEYNAGIKALKEADEAAAKASA